MVRRIAAVHQWRRCPEPPGRTGETMGGNSIEAISLALDFIEANLYLKNAGQKFGGWPEASAPLHNLIDRAKREIFPINAPPHQLTGFNSIEEIQQFVADSKSKIVSECNARGINPEPILIWIQRIEDFGTVPKRATQNETCLAVAKYIRKHPGCKGIVIARAIGITQEHFRSRIFPKLRKLGFYNKSGYQPPK
jgi:hypothetical protein